MPDRVEVFNLRDCDVTIYDESSFGVKDSGSPITTYLLYVDNAKLTNKRKVVASTAAGFRGSRPTTVMDDYHLSLTRFHAKYEEDFAVVVDFSDPTKTYFIELIFANQENPSLTETYSLGGCQLTSRALNINLITDNVSLELFVSQMTKS